MSESVRCNPEGGKACPDRVFLDPLFLRIANVELESEAGVG